MATLRSARLLAVINATQAAQRLLLPRVSFSFPLGPDVVFAIALDVCFSCAHAFVDGTTALWLAMAALEMANDDAIRPRCLSLQTRLQGLYQDFSLPPGTFCPLTSRNGAATTWSFALFDLSIHGMRRADARAPATT